MIQTTEPELNEFEPRLKSAKNQLQLSASLNFETLFVIFFSQLYSYTAIFKFDFISLLDSLNFF